MANLVRGPKEANNTDDTASQRDSEQPDGSTDQSRNRRITLLERADLDSNLESDEQLLSSDEYTQIITE